MKTNGMFVFCAILALVFASTALIFEVTALYLVAVPFYIGAALVMKNQHDLFQVILWSIGGVACIIGFFIYL